MRGIEDRHKDCFTDNKHAQRISTRFLATCHQVYDEARHIIYTTNTFGFDKAQIMDGFTSYLRNSGSGHHLEIRRVYLDVEARLSDDEHFLKTAITHYLLPRLPEVHHISINLHQGYLGVLGSRTPAEFEACHPPKHFRNMLMSTLLELGKLPLRRVTLVISDKEIFNKFGWMKSLNLGLPRWTLAEKQVWARYVKNSILQKDTQFATSSVLPVETPKRDEFRKQGLLGG